VAKFIQFNRRVSIGTKMIFFIISATALIYIISVGYISINLKNSTIRDAKLLADAYSRQYSNFAKADLNSDFDISRTIAQSYYGYKNIPDSLRKEIYNEILKNVAENNPQFVSVWSCWEISAWDSSWDKDYGRYRFTYYRKNGQLYKKPEETLNTEGDNVNSLYYKIKIDKEEFATNPYFFSYTSKKEDEILESSFCVPIVDNNKFVGLAGVDITLERFQPIISKIKPFETGYAFLISDDGTIIAHHNIELVGKKLSETDSLNNKQFKILDNIAKGNTFSFTANDNELGKSYITYSPISLGKSKSNWSLCIVVPYEAIVYKANKNFYISLLVGLIGLVITSLVITYIARRIIKPISVTTEILRKLAIGDISKSNKIKISSNDEISEMNSSVNKLIDGLNTTADFARQIGEGKLDTAYKPLSDYDELGNSLLEMRISLQNAAKEEQKRSTELI